MPGAPRWRRYLRLWGPDVAADVRDELSFHLEARIAELMEQGRPRAEAEREARRQFGDIGEVSALCRRFGEEGLRERKRAWRMEEWWYDARQGARSLVRAPWFALAAVVTLAAGIGGATSLFSIVDAWVIRAVRFAEPAQLVYVRGLNTRQGREIGVSYPDYSDWKRRSAQFQSLVAWADDSFTLTAREGTERVQGVHITPDFWTAVGVRPALGRVFTQGDGVRVAVVSHGFWKTRLNGDASAIGSKVSLNGETYTITGVLDERFHFTLSGRANLWVPLDMASAHNALRQARYLHLLGRMKPGVTVVQARQELSTIAAALAAAHPDTNRETGAFCISLNEEIGRHTGGRVVLVIFGVTLGLLLIACSNVGNLLLVRALGRRRQAAIQLSLGAGPGRLVRQALVETLALFGAAACVGSVVSAGFTRLLTGMIPFTNRGYLPDYGEAPLNWRVFAFALAITMVCGLTFGLSPALESARANLVSVLKESGSAVSLARRAKRLRWTLATAQIVLGTILVSATTLLVGGFQAAWSTPMGFESAGVLTFLLSLDEHKYTDATARRVFFESAAEAASAGEGLRAAVARFVPFGGGLGATSVRVPNYLSSDARHVPTAEFNGVSPEYFATMHARLIAGREFDGRDSQTARLVTIVNDAFVKQYFSGGSAIGQQVRLSRMGDRSVEIVGVVGEMRMNGDPHRGNPQVYVPFAQAPDGEAYLLLRPRDTSHPLAALPGIRRRIAVLDARQPVFDAKMMDERLSEVLAPYQIISGMLVWFSLLALILAAVGVYGTVAFSVSQRTREIGIRAALGAGQGALLRMLLRQGLWMLGAALAIGMPASFVAAVGLRGLFADALPPGVMRPLVLTAVVICGAVLLATIVPARKAAATDPVTAIRYE